MILESFFREQQLKEFEEILHQNNGKSMRAFLKESFFAGLVIALLVGIAGFFAKAEKTLFISGGIAAVFATVIVLVFWQLYVFEKNKRKKELLVPDALLQASMFPEKTDIAKIADYLGKADYGLLGKEFEKLHSEISKGTSVAQALENMKKRNRSRIIDRMCELLMQGHESGADMQELFREAADDLLETNSIIRDRVATMTIEKYTLIFAGGILVPAVLGLIVGMVQELSFSGFGELELGMPAEQRKAVLEMALLGNMVYIAEYALIASVFLAFQEGNRKKAIVYALLLLPSSFLAYFLAKGV